MLKRIVAARRRPGMTHAEYIAYNRDVHGGLAQANPPPGLARYVQNHVFDSAFGSDESNDHVGIFHRDSISELYFASLADMQRTFADDYARTVIGPDEVKFSEIRTNRSILTEETVLKPPQGGNTKILHVMFPAEGTGNEAASHAWASAHSAALVKAPEFAEALRGLSRNDVVPEAGVVEPTFALVVMVWIDEERLPCFRAYQRAVVANPAYDPRRSYFLYAREFTVI